MASPGASDEVSLAGGTLARLLSAVVAEPDLRARLRDSTDRAAFVAAVVAEAERRGWPLTENEVDDELRAARGRRREQWV